ncbi:hypothetical protein LLS1_05800 [Leifsonia sp. LS1]|uniref:hypothetical protein n=1 Tax=Leifsonia sp. LS1 TaxID=2828483 RepID=UPI001CFECB9D|nr:hypothetical protein [Leifsonia sp. LS1]GIT78911.1 hypothetical protein LLS1_05800 [Leifsonia sp. LS1]
MTEPTFDPRRKAAIRDLIVTTAATQRAGRGRKRTAFVVTLVLLAVGISGGGVAYALSTGLLDPVPVASPTPTLVPTPTPTETPTPTPTPTPTSTLDPADPATWTIGFDGVGPVKLGLPLTEVNGVTPTMSDETYDICRPAQLDLVAPDGLSLTAFETTASGDQVGNIHVGFNFDVGGDKTLATPRTDRGIGIGSTTAELLAAYPGIPLTGSYGDVANYYGIDGGHGTWIVFGTLHDKVNAITVGPSSTIPSEYCPA